MVIATGVASVTTQLAVIREFLCLFSGNEFVIAVTLFNWLFIGGADLIVLVFGGCVFFFGVRGYSGSIFQRAGPVRSLR